MIETDRKELLEEFERRCSADPEECPQYIWETLCEERGVDPIEAEEEEDDEDEE